MRARGWMRIWSPGFNGKAELTVHRHPHDVMRVSIDYHGDFTVCRNEQGACCQCVRDRWVSPASA